MDIESFSDKTAGQLIEALGVDSIPALYSLTHEQLVALDRFRRKEGAETCWTPSKKASRRPLGAFLFALGIPNVGSKTAKDLAKRFGTLEAVRAATREELLAIPDVGGIVAESILSFFGDVEHLRTDRPAPRLRRLSAERTGSEHEFAHRG